MTYLFIVLLCGINFAGILFPRIDIWHAEGLWFQIGIVALFGSSLIFSQNEVKIKNIPLALLTIWLGAYTFFIFYKVLLINHRYSFGGLFPFLNFICMVVFYKLCVQYLNKENIEKILNCMYCIFFVVLLYSVSQGLGFDQFQKTIEGKEVSSLATGFLGNPVHNIAYLACLSPLLFLKRKLTFFLGITIILLTNIFFGKNYLLNSASKHIQPSITGFIVLLSVLLYMSFNFSKKVFFSLLTLIICGISLFSIFNKDINIFSDSGRLSIFSSYLQLSKDTIFTGAGLGATNVISSNATDFKHIWSHLHNEYIQMFYEIGVIGILIILYGLWDFFNMKVNKDKVTIILKSILFGFVIQSSTLYPAHLWVCSIIMMFCYAGIYAIKNEELCKLSMN